MKGLGAFARLAGNAAVLLTIGVLLATPARAAENAVPAAPDPPQAGRDALSAAAPGEATTVASAAARPAPEAAAASGARQAASAAPALSGEEAGQAAAPGAGGQATLSLHKRLPRDPLAVLGVVWESPAGTLDDFLAMIEKIAGPVVKGEIDRGLQAADEKLGLSLREDLLAHLGPEFVFSADLPPIDILVGHAATQAPEGFASALGGIGFLARVRDEQRIDLALRKLFGAAEAWISDEEGLVRVTFPAGEEHGEATPVAPGVGSPDLFYGIRDGILALGFSRDWLAAALEGRPAGERLEDGEDYSRVVSHLDAEPRSLFYFNLPKAKALVRGSQVLQGLVAGNEEGGRILGWIREADGLNVGIGATTVRVEGGGLSKTFGPAWITDGTMTAGLMAAVAIPNFRNAVDRGKQKRTMADVRTIATACEAFAVDTNRYPGPTQGWVPLETIAGDLQPVYIRLLPSIDGWGNPILYWSDGQSYAILSTGKDGAADREWTLAEEPTATTAFAADILYANGQFLVYPEGVQQP